jgi:hypothetical protein
MKSQIFVAIGVAIVASVLMTGFASTIYAQSNMTGGMVGGNVIGGNVTLPSGIGGLDGGSGDGGSNGDGDGDDDSNDGEDVNDGGNN